MKSMNNQKPDYDEGAGLIVGVALIFIGVLVSLVVCVVGLIAMYLGG